MSILRRLKRDKKPIIVFGGVFDPVHKGHIAVALAAVQQFGAQKLVFLPERDPYRKQHCTPYKHRLKMLQLATQSVPQLEVLDCPDAQQTIASTFGWLNELFPKQSFIWLVGNDVVAMLSSWPGTAQLPIYGVEKLAVAIRGDAARVENIAAIDIPIYSLSAPDSAVSSSMIRPDAERAKDMVPPLVYEYILANNLYEQGNY